MAKYIMALDAGTTSNRCILFNEQGDEIGVDDKPRLFPEFIRQSLLFEAVCIL